MKIAYIGQKGIPAAFGGVEYHVQELAQRLIKRGHEVTVYVRNWYTDPGLKYYKGIRLIHTPTIRTKHFDAFMHSLTSSLHALFQDYDIIHFHALGPSVFCWLPGISGKRVVVTVHGLDWKRSKWGSLAKAFLKFTERTAIHLPDKTIAVSRAQKAYFEDKYAKNVVYIPNGVNIPAAPAAPESIKKKYGLRGRDYLLWMGRLTPEKRVEWLIEAFKHVNPNHKLVIAGGSSATADYVKKLNVLARNDKRIIFTGYVTGKEKHELLSNALLFVLPSCLEGLPIVLLEAMSHGLVCLASDIPPHREVISEGADGFLFQSATFADLLKKISRLAGGSKELKSIGENARKKVAVEYNWDEIVKATELVYYNLIHNK
ncbi:MAG: glycosyltransferase family 4 protein [Spirochaetales bacterium]|nr:glycosyltransferase family 4 protein [Spirochaetales bacterium]